jgi:hypothetical protein
VRYSVIVLALALASTLCGASALAQTAQGEARAARASAPTRVVLVASPGMEELVLRFVAELDSLHVEVVRAPDTEAKPSMFELESLAQQHEANVAVRVAEAGGAVDLWLVNPHSHELVYRRVVAGGDSAVLVLRSLEILRGALIDLRALDQKPNPKPVPAASAPPAREPTKPPELPAPAPAVWLGASAALIMPHAGHALGAGALLALRYRVASRFALHAELLAPLNAWSVAGDGGQANVRLGTATVAALVNPWADRAFSPGVGLGARGGGGRGPHARRSASRLPRFERAERGVLPARPDGAGCRPHRVAAGARRRGRWLRHAATGPAFRPKAR